MLAIFYCKIFRKSVGFLSLYLFLSFGRFYFVESAICHEVGTLCDKCVAGLPVGTICKVGYTADLF